MAFMMDGQEISNGDAGRLMVLAGRLRMEDLGMLLTMTGQSDIKNPILTFKSRERRGDFNELDPETDPEVLPPHREPLTDEEFYNRKEDVLATGGYWHKQASISILKLLWELTDGFAEDRVLRLAELASYDARDMVYPVRNGQCVMDIDELYALRAKYEAAEAAMALVDAGAQVAAAPCSDFDDVGCVICGDGEYGCCGEPCYPEGGYFDPEACYEVMGEGDPCEGAETVFAGEADMAGIPEAGPCPEPCDAEIGAAAAEAAAEAAVEMGAMPEEAGV